MPKIQFSAAGDSKAWSISLFLKKSNELFDQTFAFHDLYVGADPLRRRRNLELCGRAVTDFIAWCGRGGA
jgi:hypothetical protein